MMTSIILVESVGPTCFADCTNLGTLFDITWSADTAPNAPLKAAAAQMNPALTIIKTRLIAISTSTVDLIYG
jgi:hypothetical protein